MTCLSSINLLKILLNLKSELQEKKLMTVLSMNINDAIDISNKFNSA